MQYLNRPRPCCVSIRVTSQAVYDTLDENQWDLSVLQGEGVAFRLNAWAVGSMRIATSSLSNASEFDNDLDHILLC